MEFEPASREMQPRTHCRPARIHSPSRLRVSLVTEAQARKGHPRGRLGFEPRVPFPCSLEPIAGRELVWLLGPRQEGSPSCPKFWQTGIRTSSPHACLRTCSGVAGEVLLAWVKKCLKIIEETLKKFLPSCSIARCRPQLPSPPFPAPGCLLCLWGGALEGGQLLVPSLCLSFHLPPSALPGPGCHGVSFIGRLDPPWAPV